MALFSWIKREVAFKRLRCLAMITAVWSDSTPLTVGIPCGSRLETQTTDQKHLPKAGTHTEPGSDCRKTAPEKTKILQTELQVGFVVTGQAVDNTPTHFCLHLPTCLQGMDRGTADVLRQAFLDGIDIPHLNDMLKLSDLRFISSTGDRDSANIKLARALGLELDSPFVQFPCDVHKVL
jgi:hypothetical protein